MSESAVGEVMESRLRDSIFGFTGWFKFRRNKEVVDGTTFQAVCFFPWSYACDAPADERRWIAIAEVGGGFDCGSWRRAHGPEREICRRLAEHLLDWFDEAPEVEEGGIAA